MAIEADYVGTFERAEESQQDNVNVTFNEATALHIRIRTSVIGRSRYASLGRVR